MNKLQLISIPLLLVLASACSAGMSEEADGADPATDTEMAADAGIDGKTSYAIGWQTGQSFVRQEMEIDEESLMQGLREGLAGGESKWTDEEMGAALQELQRTMRARQQAKAKEQSTSNAAEGTAFLESNGAREGVTTTESGLQYEVLTAGDGAKPAATDTVTVHYRGTLLDGTEFDSSYARNQPATFPLSGVIGGWTEGLQLMGIGAKWKFFIPSELAYGMRGSPPKIGPGVTLIFEVELLEIAGQ